MPDFLLSEAIFVVLTRCETRRWEQEHSRHADFLSCWCDTRTSIHNWFLCITALKHFSLRRYSLFFLSIATYRFEFDDWSDDEEKSHITPILNAPFFPVEIRFFPHFFSFFPNSINAGSVFDMWMSFEIQWQGKNGKERETTISVTVNQFGYKKLNKKKNRPLQQKPKLMRHSCFQYNMFDIEKSSHWIMKSIEFGGRLNIIYTWVSFRCGC